MKKPVGQIRPVEKEGIKGKKPSSEGPVRAQKALTVLLVDDYKNTLRILEAIVSGLGHNAKTAKDGVEALKIFKEGGVDLVITDFKMPGMNGIELLEELKKHDPEAKVVLATSYGKMLDKEAIVTAGAITVMDKPLDMNEIKNVIETVSRN